MLVRPRSTFRALLARDEGHLGEIVPWLVLLSAAGSPVRTGRALLLARADLLDGLFVFAIHLQARLQGLLIGLLLAALLLTLVGARRGARIGYGRALDIAAFALVPTLLLMATGIVVSAAGVDLWFLPHHPVRGGLPARALAVGVGYGWSMVLLGIAAVELWRRPAPPD